MSIVYRQVGSSTTATNPTVALTPLAGSLLVAHCCTLALGEINPALLSIADNQGNTWRSCDLSYGDLGTIHLTLRIYYALNVAAAATTVTYTTNRNGAIFQVTEFTGATAFVGQWVRGRQLSSIAITNPTTYPITVPGLGLFVAGFVDDGSPLSVSTRDWVAQAQIASSAIMAPAYAITYAPAESCAWFVSATSPGPVAVAAFSDVAPSFVQQGQLGRGRS